MKSVNDKILDFVNDGKVYVIFVNEELPVDFANDLVLGIEARNKENTTLTEALAKERGKVARLVEALEVIRDRSYTVRPPLTEIEIVCLRANQALETKEGE